MSNKARVVNLDEYRLAAGEDAHPTVVLGGKTYELPAELSMLTVVSIRDGDLAGVVRGLFGTSAKKVIEAGLSVKDLDRIAKDAYGMLSGESAASPG